MTTPQKWSQSGLKSHPWWLAAVLVTNSPPPGTKQKVKIQIFLKDGFRHARKSWWNVMIHVHPMQFRLILVIQQNCFSLELLLNKSHFCYNYNLNISFAAFPRQHRQQLPQEESIWALVLRPVCPSRPLGVARAHRSTHGAAGLRWLDAHQWPSNCAPRSPIDRLRLRWPQRRFCIGWRLCYLNSFGLLTLVALFLTSDFFYGLY